MSRAIDVVFASGRPKGPNGLFEMSSGECILNVRHELVHSDIHEMLIDGDGHQVELMGRGPKRPVEKRIQLEQGVGTPQGEAMKPQFP